LNIEGLGEELIDSLVDSDLIKNPADLYKLTYEKLIGLKLNGGSSVQNLTAVNLLNSINKSKQNDLWRLIYGLGIRQVGEATAKQLAEVFGDINKIRMASPILLMLIDEVGYETAHSIQSFFLEKERFRKPEAAGLLLLGQSDPVEVLQRRADSHVFQVRASWMPI
jgi:DNA ligase (NAD+)